jgi:membrane-bound lytic murein transglycosylase A
VPRPLVAIMVLASINLSIAPAQSEPRVFSLPTARLEPLAWTDIVGWAEDDHAAAFTTFLASCRAIVSGRAPVREARVIDAPLAEICRQAVKAGSTGERRARAFFERRFRPVHIAKLEESEGFLTGYYEPVVEGSRVSTPEFTVPMYRRPDDLIPEIAPAGAQFANKGLAWRQVGDTRVPYYDRAEIEDGALAGKGLEICWLKSPIDAFFIHIQGSARVRLQDGKVLRLNYAAHNGQPYTAVGGLLIRRNEIAREEMSMDRIRQWMLAKPEEAKELRRQNRSFIFFRVAELKDDEEAVGAQGIPLKAGRSIAVDRHLHAYGTPFWIDAELPLSGETAKDRFRRLMIAQDTGSAILGPARGDIYFGAGEEAGRIAGRIKHPGRFVMLVPKSMPLNQAGSKVPHPPSRPVE